MSIKSILASVLFDLDIRQDKFNIDRILDYCEKEIKASLFSDEKIEVIVDKIFDCMCDNEHLFEKGDITKILKEELR